MRIILAAGFSVMVGSSMVQASGLSAFYSSAVFFGDSLSDTGNLGIFAPPPPYFDGQFSNGPNFADILDDPFAPVNTENYALGGATTSGGLIPDLDLQITGFGIDLLGAGDEPLQLGARPLASIWMGANNLFGALDAFGDGLIADDPVQIAAAQAVALGAASDIGDALQRLIDDFSIRDFLVLNLPDLGLTPRILGEAGLSSEARELTETFNDGLVAEIAGLVGSDLDVALIDVFQIFDQTVAGERLPELTNLDTPCLAAEGPDFAACSTYLFWDEVHPTAVAHAELARVVSAQLAPIPLGPTLPMLGFSVVALAYLSRKQRA